MHHGCWCLAGWAMYHQMHMVRLNSQGLNEPFTLRTNLTNQFVEAEGQAPN